MGYQTIIWDIDGTLLNTAEGLTEAYRYTIEKLNLSMKTNAEIRRFIGPIPQSVFSLQFGLDAAQAQRAADIFRERYKTRGLLKAHLYRGVTGVLDILKKRGLKQAVATNKRQDYALEICRHFQIDSYCGVILGTDNAGAKNKADLIKECLQILGNQNAIMIGDTEGDRTAAEEAGISFAGVNYGFGFQNVAGYAGAPFDILKMIER